MFSEELKAEMAALSEGGHQLRHVVEGNKVFIIFENYKLPEGLFNMQETELMVWTTISYPSTGFDMFWVNPNLLLKNGNRPQAGEHLENHMSKQWRRFSIHPYQNNSWKPHEDSLTGYLCHIQNRLNQGI